MDLRAADRWSAAGAPDEVVAWPSAGALGDVVVANGRAVRGRRSRQHAVVERQRRALRADRSGRRVTTGTNRLVVTAVDDSEESLRAIADDIRTTLELDRRHLHDVPDLPARRFDADRPGHRPDQHADRVARRVRRSRRTRAARLDDQHVDRRTDPRGRRHAGARWSLTPTTASAPADRRRHHRGRASDRSAARHRDQQPDRPHGARGVRRDHTRIIAVNWTVVGLSAVGALLGARLVAARAARKVVKLPLAEALRDRDGSPFGRRWTHRLATRVPSGGLFGRLADPFLRAPSRPHGSGDRPDRRGRRGRVPDPESGVVGQCLQRRGVRAVVLGVGHPNPVNPVCPSMTRSPTAAGCRGRHLGRR